MNSEMRGLRRDVLAVEEFCGEDTLVEAEDGGLACVSAEPDEPVVREPVNGSELAEEGGSVFALIRVSLFARRIGSGFVDHGLADLILFAGPIAKVEKPAPLAAERKLGRPLRIDRLAADGAAPSH